MNKNELVDAIAERTGVARQDVLKSISGMFDVLADTVRQGGDVTIQGWLKVERVNRNARMGRNPQTGEPIEIPATTATKVTALSKLKAAGKT